MRFPKQRLGAVALAALATLVSCSEVQRVQVTPPTTKGATNAEVVSRCGAAERPRRVCVSVVQPVIPRLAGRQQVAANARAVDQARVLLAQAAVQIAEAGVTGSVGVRASTRRAGATPAPSVSLDGIRQCIKNHESGNYAEQSHVGSGSGAYQYVPGTWRTWSARAGFDGYLYAYQAPAPVQDAVTDYVLTHGGAGNWSPRFGNDPCTVGIGG